MANAKLLVLRSPFNGGTWVVPPDCPPETLAYLLEHAGFTRVDDEEAPRDVPIKGKAKPKEEAPA